MDYISYFWVTNYFKQPGLILEPVFFAMKPIRNPGKGAITKARKKHHPNITMHKSMFSTPSGPKLHFWPIKYDSRVMQCDLIVKIDISARPCQDKKRIACPVNQTLSDPAAKNKSSQESNSFWFGQWSHKYKLQEILTITMILSLMVQQLAISLCPLC